MALATNALTTVNSLGAYMRAQPRDTDLLSVYHDESASATAATVEVTGSAVVLVITGGDNAGTETLTFAAYTTITTMAAAINALAKGWVATVQNNGGEASGNLNVFSQTSAFGTGNEQYLQGADDVLYEKAINAASDAIERLTNRVFGSASYRQLLCGTGTPKLPLRQYPVTAVSRVCIGMTSALRVRNTSSDAYYATVANDGTNISLVVRGGANADSSTVAIATKTITELATAIEAIGKGWEAAAVNSTTGAWLAADLLYHQPRGALNQYLTLMVPDDPEDGYDVEAESGILTRGSLSGLPGFWGDAYGVVYSPGNPRTPMNPGSEPGICWPAGHWNVYVAYTAGYSTIPEDLELLCCELAANMIRAGVRDTELTSESGPDYSWSARGNGALAEHLRKRLAPWRYHRPPSVVNV